MKDPGRQRNNSIIRPLGEGMKMKEKLTMKEKIAPGTWILILFMAVGIIARGWMLGDVPGGINQDEAFGAYEAYSLLHYGMDDWGYRFPVYLNTWGSGMNALNTYLMIPFIAIFGLDTWVIRMPQFLVSCFTLYIAYKLLLKLFNQNAALTGLLILAVCPWHIMMSRWGLESNLAPGFLLFGFYFFVLAAEQPKYFLLSALFYGLSLYCYATIWPIVPLMIFLQLLYLLWTKKLHFNRYVVISIFIIALLALPLILFLLVNYGYLGEIRTPFLSIPKLTKMRKGEIYFYNKRQNLQDLITMLLKQKDDWYWNAAPEFGLYYSKWMLVFGVIGFFYCCKTVLVSIWKREYEGASLLLVPFVCAVFLGCLIPVNINRINCIHLPIILFISVGVYLVMERLIKFCKKYGKWIPLAFVGIAGICFLRFEIFYFTTYRENIGSMFQEDLKDAVSYALTLAGEEQDIVVDFSFSYPKLMYYSQISPIEYRNSVQYVNYPNEYLISESFGQFRFGISEVKQGQICIIPADLAADFLSGGWQMEQFGHIAVAY